MEGCLSLRRSTSFIRRFYWQTVGRIVFLMYTRQLTSRHTSFRSYCPPVELLIYEPPNGKSPGQEGRVTGCSYGDEQAGWGGQEKETSCFKLTDAAQKKNGKRVPWLKVDTIFIIIIISMAWRWNKRIWILSQMLLGVFVTSGRLVWALVDFSAGLCMSWAAPSAPRLHLPEI